MTQTAIEPGTSLHDLVKRLDDLSQWLDRLPYSILLYLESALTYSRLAYPDLAVGAAYKALLLSDAVLDSSDEYHDLAIKTIGKSFSALPPELRTVCLDLSTASLAQLEDEYGDEFSQETKSALSDWLESQVLPLIHTILVDNLIECGCYRSAYRQLQQGLIKLPRDVSLLSRQSTIIQRLRKKTTVSGAAFNDDPETWPDAGLVRRECYPWNDVEPDRFSQESLDFMNRELAKCAPKLEVRAVMLPALNVDDTSRTVKQLGVFAKDDIGPGEMVLSETSLLTANNRLQDALCDACSVDLTSESGHILCDECTVPFCSAECFATAQTSYHPALCDQDVDSIAKDVPPAQAADSLYLLLLLRSFAMAVTQGRHPLALAEVKYIWGDYHMLDVHRLWSTSEVSPRISAFPRSLHFSFDLNVLLPFHMLTKMNVDIFASHRDFDVWIFNTLYAKFRGTASARLSGKSSLGGLKLSRARGPEVSAVHPCWCLANHSCDPNVSWEWGGKVQFRSREERVEWIGPDGDKIRKNTPGVKKNEEILNHYCDINLQVRQRREWAVGALGGDCQCERCVYEADE